MTSDRMRVAGTAALRLFAVTLGLGFVWFVSAHGDVNAGVVAAVAIVAATAGFAALSASMRILIRAIVALLGASVAGPPAERVDLPATITQSRPDAPGRPQPRAPGRVLAAA